MKITVMSLLVVLNKQKRGLPLSRLTEQEMKNRNITLDPLAQQLAH